MSEASSEEREDWVRLSLQCLARAYSDDEPEYSRDQIKKLIPNMNKPSAKCDNLFPIQVTTEVMK